MMSDVRNCRYSARGTERLSRRLISNVSMHAGLGETIRKRRCWRSNSPQPNTLCISSTLSLFARVCLPRALGTFKVHLRDPPSFARRF